ncbi:MAG: hypothetical protein ACRDH7_07475 [Actinomycetota bacterium]
MVLLAKFQTNDKPWSDPVLPQDWESTYRKRLIPFRGELRLDSPGELPGPYRPRKEAIHRAVTRFDHEDNPGLTIFISNRAHKGVRAQLIRVNQPFGPIFHTTGPCKDNYPNIVVDHNAAGQLVKLQRCSMLAYHEAERLNGKPITITGEGWRSCSQQSALYHSDPGRFANPDDSRHCRGLAIDVTNTPANLTTKAKASLESVGFCQGVSGEPWHFAFSECG